MDDSMERRTWLDKLVTFMDERRTPITSCPTISKNPLDLFRLYIYVKERGGFMEVCKVQCSSIQPSVSYVVLLFQYCCMCFLHSLYTPLHTFLRCLLSITLLTNKRYPVMRIFSQVPLRFTSSTIKKNPLIDNLFRHTSKHALFYLLNFSMLNCA